MKNEYDIRKIQFSSGAYWIETVYTGKIILNIDFNKLVCKYSYKSNFYKNIIKWKISKKYLIKFYYELMVLDVFSWNKVYKENAEDGGYWSLKIEYQNNEIFEVNSDNSYPDNYFEFFNILQKYFPIIKMDNEYRKNIENKNVMQAHTSHNKR